MTNDTTASTDVAKRAVLIGSICIHWSHLELLLAATIWSLLKVNDRAGMLVTGGLDIQGRASMASSLARELKAPNELVDALKRVNDQLSPLAAERNLAVHGVYRVEISGSGVSAMVHRGKFRGARQDMSVARLTALAEGICSIIDDLTPLLSALGIVDLDPPASGAP